MPPKRTDKASLSTASASITAAALPGLKSTAYSLSRECASAADRGRLAEQRVLEYFQSYAVYRRAWRTPFAEVDLVLVKNPRTLLMLEVKSITNLDFLPTRIGTKQKMRLFRAYEYLLAQLASPFDQVELNWAFVTDQGDVLVIEDVYC